MEFKQTLGEFRVGVSFNPSNDNLVDRVKALSAELVDLINSIPVGDEATSFSLSNEKLELKSAAMRSVEFGAMLAVKSVTKPEPV